jgi:hypothetical protein
MSLCNKRNEIFFNIFFSDLGNTAGMETKIRTIFPRVLNLCYSFNVPLLAEMSVRRTFVYRDTAFDRGTALPPRQEISCFQSEIDWMDRRLDV